MSEEIARNMDFDCDFHQCQVVARILSSVFCVEMPSILAIRCASSRDGLYAEVKALAGMTGAAGSEVLS